MGKGAQWTIDWDLLEVGAQTMAMSIVIGEQTTLRGRERGEGGKEGREGKRGGRGGEGRNKEEVREGREQVEERSGKK